MAIAAQSESGQFKLLFTEMGGFNEKDRIQMRPLGRVSDFVIERLPDELALIHRGQGSVHQLSAFADEIMPSNLSLKVVANGEGRDIALLDMKMLMFGIIHSGGEPGPRLRELVRKFSELADQPESITYEEIILVNPEKDPRLFTDGRVGNEEYDFYNLHRLVEPVLEDAIVATENARLSMKSGDFQSAAAYIAQGTAHINLGAQHVEIVGQGMNVDLFNAFRQYLGEYKEAGLPGPSGAFTARIPLLDMALAGEQFPAEYYRSIGVGDQLIFFPREGRRKMETEIARIANAKNESLVGLFKSLGYPEGIGINLELMRQALLTFRKSHYRGVVKQVPAAVNDSIAGTGGQVTPGSFLRDRIRFLKDIVIEGSGTIS